MPTFYDKLFKPSKTKGLSRLYRCKRNEWHPKQEVFEKPVPIKDVEAQIFNEWFKTNKKSLANQNPKKKESK